MMSKRTHISVLTTFDSIRVGLAEFCFVFLRVVEVFNTIVTHVAVFAALAISRLQVLWTQFRDVVYWGSSAISLLSLVVVETFF